ncbi:MAG: shikimate kinase [Lachnospiraceae bacterium]|nr:shikimate kinase [Lachnospiraceae bacterium]
MNHIILTGFMGSGKGAVAKGIAEALKLPIYDVDKMVGEKLKMSAADVYSRFGDVYARAEETFILGELLQKKERGVIVLGSALPLMTINDTILKALGKVYWLKISKKTAVAAAQENNLEWVKGDIADVIGKMLKERDAAYKRISDVVMDADAKTREEIIWDIVLKAGDK